MREKSIFGGRKDNYFSFLWLAGVCVVVFLLQVSISWFTDAFLLNGEALSGEYYRFLTAIFLHGGVSHLIYNLFALLFFGLVLESTVGTKRFLIVFFGSGILANVVSVFFYGSSLGASGAIYGILGCVAVLRPGMMVWAFGVVMPMFLAAILWIVGDLIGLFIPSNTGHIAHLSGVVVGLFVGLYLRSRFSKRKRRNLVEIPEGYVRRWEDTFMR